MRHFRDVQAIQNRLFLFICLVLTLDKHNLLNTLVVSLNNAGQGGGAGAGGAAGGAGGAAGGAVVPGTQDAVQIVAQAALCFDNRQVTILPQSRQHSKLNSSHQLLSMTMRVHINKVLGD